MMALDKRWYQRSLKAKLICFALLPLSLIYRLIDRLNYYKTRQKIELTPPVIVIGNIVAGGSGKSLMVIWLANQLKEWGYNPGIISRGFGVQANDLALDVTGNSSAHLVGDEPLMIHHQTQCPVVVHSKRMMAYESLIENHTVDIVISDDGLQHYALPRQAEIILIDGERGFGNGFLLPAGPKREPISRLKSADLVLSKAKPHTHASAYFELINAPLISLNQQPIPAFGTKVIALCAIANPQSFLTSLSSFGFEIELKAFDDHHEFNHDDVSEFKDKIIITTQKDAVKLTSLNLTNVFVLPIVINLPEKTIVEIQQLVDSLCQKSPLKRKTHD
jgi:tetraacyldisaccharide 4'-kinase